MEETGLPVADGRRSLVLGPTTIPASGKLEVAVDFEDSPGRGHALAHANALFDPARVNDLREAQLEAAFVTVFAAIDPLGVLHPLQHFYWNVTCQATFTHQGAGGFRSAAHHDVRLRIQPRVQAGMPADRRFRGHEADDALPICVPVLNGACASPLIQYGRVWGNFHVGHPLT